MKPLSSIYYIRNNKGRALLIIFMLFFTTLIFVAGNYVKSIEWYWKESLDYEEKIATINCLPTDEDYKEYYQVREEIKKDPKLKWLDRSGYGFGGMDWMSTMGFAIGGHYMVFNSREDMETAFSVLGIKADLSKVKDHSMVIGKGLADNKGLKLGDTVDRTVDKTIDSSYTLDAIIDGNTYSTFYLVESDNNFRTYVYSDEMEGDELYNYLTKLIGNRKVKLSERSKVMIENQLTPMYLIFTVGIIILSVILAVTVNSVVNGQYIRRTYEFGVYRALGISRGGIFRKCASEMLLMDLIAVLVGAGVCFLATFLLNELYYIPGGRYLPYFSGLGLIGFLISNATVLLPMILSKGIRMGKADVTEF